MAKFTDSEKREWVVYIDIPIARKIRRELDVNLLKAGEGFTSVSDDPILFCDVMYLICEEQAKKRNVSDEDFGRMMFSETLGKAADAFVDAMVNFSPPQQKEILRGQQEVAKALQETLVTMATEQIPPAIQALLDAVGKRSLGGLASSATNPPAPSEN